jgi:putative acetyltransferase
MIALDAGASYQALLMSSSPAPLIRDALDADGPALAGLIAAIFADYPGVAFLADEFPELQAPASHFAAKGGCLILGEEEGEIIACFGVLPTHRREVATFSKVYVAKEARGRGMAARLLRRALGHARALGASRISLWSDLKFLDGHRFYLRHGFVRGPGVRALHDASETLEINFRLDPIPAARSE